MSLEDISTEIGAAVETARTAFEPKLLDVIQDPASELPAAPVLLIPEGMTAQSVKVFVDEWRTEPERRKGVAVVTTLDSFVALVNRFKDAGSAVFCDSEPSSPKLIGVLNYHPPQNAAPRYNDHRVLYRFPVAEEWMTWTGSDGNSYPQADFAAFIEAHIADVADPSQAGDSVKELCKTLGVELASPARLMALSRGLAVNVGAKVAQAVNLTTGEASIRFETEHSGPDGAPLKIPGAFLLALPVFRSGERYQVAARLRYRVLGGAIVWSFSLHRTDIVFDHAIGEAAKKAQTGTDLPLYFGTPEV